MRLQTILLTVIPLGILKSVTVSNGLLTLSLYPIIYTVRKVNWELRIWKSVTVSESFCVTVTGIIITDFKFQLEI